MKSLFITLMLLFLCAPAFADPAAVIEDFGCGGFIPDDEGGILAYLYTEESHAVVTSKGVTNFTCHFDHDFPLDHATGAKGFLCGTQGGLTEDTMMFASPGGRAVLVCKIHEKAD